MEEFDRYSRHILLKMIGMAGHEKIRKARVLVTGIGALGSMISILLARAGVESLRLVDKDTPEMNNLHRQILYSESDVLMGLSKAEAARANLLKTVSNVAIDAVNVEIDKNSIYQLLDDVDIVVDALDNAETRFIVNDAILDRKIPYVFGGAVETMGNVMTIIPGKTACLRCLWPDSSCSLGHARASTVGVLSSVASLIASIEVTEAFKVLVGDLDSLIQGIMVLDVWKNDYHVVPIVPASGCICSNI